MKSPLFEQSAGALAALLAGVPKTPYDTAYADLYTINCVGGQVLRYTNSDVDISDLSGNVWIHGAVRVDDPSKRALAHWAVGVPVDKWVVYFYPRTVDALTGAADPDKIGSIPFAQACRGGALDNALVTVDRAWIVPPIMLPAVLKPVGAYRIFTGTIGEVDVGYGVCVLNIDSLTSLLNTQMPVNLFQYGCAHTLFGPGCNNSGSLPAASFAQNAAVTSSALSPPTITAAALAIPGGSATYALGKIQITDGPNKNFWRMIIAWDAGTKTMTLSAPFPFTLSAGDPFTAYPGCDKTKATCTLFANLLNYGGEPDIPVPESSF